MGCELIKGNPWVGSEELDCVRVTYEATNNSDTDTNLGGYFDILQDGVELQLGTPTSEYARDLVFFTPSEVSEFKFNSLKAVNSDNGELTFAEEELYSLDSLVMDKAVTITVEFPGDTPNYGISYKDAAGNIKRYAICEGGFDGSIYLMRYENVQ